MASKSDRGRILIVEDQAIIAMDIQRQLEVCGYDVTGIAGTARKAFESASGSVPDLVLMDIRLRGRGDGIEAGDTFRRRFDIPVIFVTSHSDEQTLSRAKLAEPYGYLVKPVSRGNLATTIDVALHRHRAESRIRKNEAWLNTILSSIGDGVIAVDPHLNIQLMNAAAVKLIGCSMEEGTGKPLHDVVQLQHLETGERQAWALPATDATWIASHALHTLGGRREIMTGLAPIVHNDSVTGGVLVMRDITALQSSQHSLRKANEVLARANADLSQLAHALSHDLREPLRMILMFSQLIAKRYGDVLGPEGREFADYSIHGAQALLNFVGSLLEYYGTQRVTTLRGPTDSNKCLADALYHLRVSIEESGAEITQDELPAVAVHEVVLLQLFQNLVGNAIKYRRCPPKIHVSSTLMDGWCMFSVADNGCGVSPEKSEVIFGLLQRAHGRDIPGAGIGLAMCRRLVEQHKGKIWVESTRDVGSTFFFTLLLAAEEPEMSRAEGA
jgi:PAS domain S-box-containing protein